MDRTEELLEYLESTDVSRLQRWGGLGYSEFWDAVDKYCHERDYENWRNMLKAIANMIKAARGEANTNDI